MKNYTIYSDRITLVVKASDNDTDWDLWADDKQLSRHATKEDAVEAALTMARNNPHLYAVCVEDESPTWDYYGHRRGQVVFSAAVVVGSLIMGFVLGCIAAGMKAGVFKW